MDRKSTGGSTGSRRRPPERARAGTSCLRRVPRVRLSRSPRPGGREIAAANPLEDPRVPWEARARLSRRPRRLQAEPCEPCEYCIADRRGYGCRHPEHLVDVERVARGSAIKFGCVDVVALCECPTASADSGWRRTLSIPVGGELSENHRNGCARSSSSSRYVRIVRDERFDSAPDQAKHVERGLVRPMEVFENEHRRTVGKFVAHGFEHVVGTTALLEKRHAALRRSRVQRRPNGLSGRGVKSGSHAPVRMRVERLTLPANARTSDVFPTPASPATRTSRPVPVSLRSARRGALQARPRARGDRFAARGCTCDGHRQILLLLVGANRPS